MENEEMKNEVVENTNEEPQTEATQVEQTNVETTQQGNTRPAFLTVLCILSFISGGLGVLFGLLAIVGIGTLLSYLGNPEAITGGTTYMIVLVLIAAGSLYGAIQMWNLKKMGFYIYSVVNILGVLLPVVFGLGFSVFSAIITAAFIVMYYLNIKYMS